MPPIPPFSATIIKSAICKTNAFPRPNPSLFYFPGLRSMPIYPPDNFQTISNILKLNHTHILNEYNHLQNIGYSSDYEMKPDEHKLHQGKWEWQSYILKGKKQVSFQNNCPITSSILDSIPNIMYQTPFSYTFFSKLHANTTINAHYGPCNLRIRCHYPLIVPPSGDYGMKIGGTTVRWTVGEPIYFDDCYEHKVWNNSNNERVVLLFDMWHPDLHPEEISAIIDMFGHAREKGWIQS
eukprot:gene13499-28638_t